MNAGDLRAALGEVAGITKVTRSRGITVLTVDTQATVHPNITRPDQVELTGGGGTDMRVGIEAACAQRPRPDVVAVLTDGYTPWPATPPAAKLIAVLIGDNPPPVPSWATTVHVTTHAGGA